MWDITLRMVFGSASTSTRALITTVALPPSGTVPRQVTVSVSNPQAVVAAALH